jgi:signal transduction histidine kinase
MAKKPHLPEDLTEKENLLDLLIHDLRGPLAVASTSASHLLRDGGRYGPLTDKQRHILNRVIRNAEKAQTLLQEMIEIFYSKEGLFHKELFPIEKIVMDSILDVLETTSPDVAEKLSQTQDKQVLQEVLKTQGIFVNVTGKYSRSPFPHDPKKVRQVLRNLIGNALKFRRERISISVDGEGDLVVAVEDDGIGIPLKEQHVIFERFVRLDDKMRPDVPGHGLGLSGVKALMAAMKGKITLESREGSGTRFIVRIPPLP